MSASLFKIPSSDSREDVLGREIPPLMFAVQMSCSSGVRTWVTDRRPACESGQLSMQPFYEPDLRPSCFSCLADPDNLVEEGANVKAGPCVLVHTAKSAVISSRAFCSASSASAGAKKAWGRLAWFAGQIARWPSSPLA